MPFTPFTNTKASTTSGKSSFAPLGAKSASVSNVPTPIPTTIQQPQTASLPTKPVTLGGIASGIGNFVKNTADSLANRGQNIVNDIANPTSIAPANDNSLGSKIGNIVGKVAQVGSTAGHVAGQVAGGVGDIIGNAISPLLPDGAKQAIGGFAQQVNDKIASLNLPPDVVKSLGDVFNTVSLMAPEKAGINPAVEDVTNAVKSGADTAVQTGKDALGTVKQGLSDASKVDVPVKKILTTVPEKLTNGITDTIDNTKGLKPNDLQKINDLITPKPTATEAKNALNQGRLYEGKKPSLLKAGTDDKIATSQQQAEAVRTIAKQIPGAANMDSATLHSALDEQIGNISKNLKPQLEKIPIKPETVQKINDSWQNLKKTQLQDAKATDEPNVMKWQANFEKYLQKSGNGNLNDLWESAKKYDASIKSNVKNATDISPEDLQTQKQLWLQNRAILKDAINDSANGLGKTSQGAFSDMTNMFEAQKGIASKASVDTKVQPSKLSQAYNSKPGKIIRTVGKIGLGGEVLKQGLGL